MRNANAAERESIGSERSAASERRREARRAAQRVYRVGVGVGVGAGGEWECRRSVGVRAPLVRLVVFALGHVRSELVVDTARLQREAHVTHYFISHKHVDVEKLRRDGHVGTEQ